MAAITGAVITAGVAAYGANQQKKAAQGAANAAQGAADAATAEQRRQFDITQQNMAPFIEAARFAMPRLQDTFNGNFTGFYDSPDYKATQEQGLSFLDRSAAMGGRLNSGGHSADLLKFGSNLAAQQIGNYRSGLMGLAGMGQSSAQSLGQFGANMANQIGGNIWGAANARASGYQQRADANSQLAAGLGGLFNGYMQQRQASQVPSYSGGLYSSPATTATGGNWMNAYGYRS